MARKLIYVGGAILVVLLLGLLLLPLAIDANQFRPRIESMLGDSLNRTVRLGDIRLSVFSGGVAVRDLAISDDPAFSRGDFLTANSVTIGVELWPLISSRELRLTGLTIDQPHVTLLRSPAGAWNFSTLGAAQDPPARPSTASATPQPSGAAAPSFFIRQLAIRSGTVLVGDVGASARHEYTNVNLDASNLSYTTQFPFSLTMQAPGGGSISLAGQAGPLDPADAQQTPFEARLEVQDLDLRASGFVQPSSGIAGLLDFAGDIASDGRRITTRGRADAARLQLTPGGSPAAVPVRVDYETEYEMPRQAGVLKQGDVRLGNALARLTGTYRKAGDTTAVQMKLSGQGMPATDLQAVLPALGVSLPSGASLRDGTFDADLTISGPLDRLVTTGPVTLTNGRLTGFSLSSQMAALAAFAGLPKGSDTVIETMSSGLRIAPEGIRADNFRMVVAGVGMLTGNGTIGADKTLDFRMVASLTGSPSSPLSSIAEIASARLGRRIDTSNIPFRIQGTTERPVFVPDVRGIAGSLQGQDSSGSQQTPQQPQSLGEAIRGLFGGRDQQKQ